MAMYSDIFCKVYDAFGWNYYPEIFGQQLLTWLERRGLQPKTCLDLACGTGVLCQLLRAPGRSVRGMDFSAGMIDIARQRCPDLLFEVADMITYRPQVQFDLVTCTGDALNHIPAPADLEEIFRNVYGYLRPGGWFVFDLLGEGEISTSEPFEMDFSEAQRVWFQMTRPEKNRVNLRVLVFEEGTLALEETICEALHDPAWVCARLEACGFSQVECRHRLLEEGRDTATWFVTAKK